MSSSEESSDPSTDVPKPSTPKPSIPKPNVPAPSATKTPAPNLTSTESAPPASKFESGAMEQPAQKPESAAAEPVTPPAEETILHKRILATLIDGILAGATAALLQAILPGSALDKLAIGVAAVYLLLKDALPLLGGQSVGKKVFGLKALTAAGQPLTNNFKASAIRNIFLIIPVMPLVELIILSTREDTPKRGLRLGDEFANTIVQPERPSTPVVEDAEL